MSAHKVLKMISATAGSSHKRKKCVSERNVKAEGAVNKDLIKKNRRKLTPRKKKFYDMIKVKKENEYNCRKCLKKYNKQAKLLMNSDSVGDEGEEDPPQTKYFDIIDFSQHMKSHFFKCSTCEKYFKDRKTLAKHLNRHTKLDLLHKTETVKVKETTQEHADALDKGEVSEALKDQTRGEKVVSWCKDIKTVEEIPITKVALKKKTAREMIKIKRHTDDILATLKKMSIDELRKLIENRTYKPVEERMLEAMLSVCPSHYAVTMLNEDILVEIKTAEPATKAAIAARRKEFKCEVWKARERRDKYIDLIYFAEKPVLDLEQGINDCVPCGKKYSRENKLRKHNRRKHSYTGRKRENESAVEMP